MSSSNCFSSTPGVDTNMLCCSKKVAANLETDTVKSSRSFCNAPVDETSRSFATLPAPPGDHPNIKLELSNYSLTKQSVVTEDNLNPNSLSIDKVASTSLISTAKGGVKTSSSFLSKSISDSVRFDRPLRRRVKKFIPSVRCVSQDARVKSQDIRVQQNSHHRSRTTATISRSKFKRNHYTKSKAPNHSWRLKDSNQQSKVKELKYQDVQIRSKNNHPASTQKLKVVSKEPQKFAINRNSQASILTQSTPNEINMVPCKILTRETNLDTSQNFSPSCNKISAHVVTKGVKSETIQANLSFLNSKIAINKVPSLNALARHSLQKSPLLKSAENEKPKLLQPLEPKSSTRSYNNLTTSTCFSISQPPSCHSNRELDLKSVSSTVIEKGDLSKVQHSNPVADKRVTGFVKGYDLWNKAPKLSNLMSKTKLSLNAGTTQKFTEAAKESTPLKNKFMATSAFLKANQQLSTAYKYLLSNEIIKQRWTLRKPSRSRNLKRNPFSISSSLASFIITEDPTRGWKTLSDCLSDWAALQHKIYNPQREIHISFNKDVSQKYPCHNFTQANMLIACKIQLNDRGKACSWCQVDVCCEQLRLHSSHSGNKGELAVWTRIHNTYYTRFVQELRRRIINRLKLRKEES